MRQNPVEYSSPVTAWGPLRNRDFRMLWGAWLSANLCLVMSEVSAAWLMTSLSRQTLLVALVQSASTLPVFLLVLPFGAMVDMVNRKRWLLFTQGWLFVTSLALALSTWMGVLSAQGLLALVFANGIGMAMRWPAFISIIPEMVVPAEVPQALALQAMAMNGARILGPLLAGVGLTMLGSTFVFASCSLLSLLAAVVIWRCRYTSEVHAGPHERFMKSIWAGMEFVARSQPMRIVLAHIFAACLQVFALIALLPAVASGLGEGGSGSYALLMSFMGTGAVAVGFGLPLLRGRFDAKSVDRKSVV